MEIQGIMNIVGYLFIVSFVGRSHAQVPGGIVLGGDFMMDTPMGELPTPLVAGMTDPGPSNTMDSGQHNNRGGGFDNQGLLSMFLTSSDGSSDGNLPLDPSSIAGIANGQSIFLPGSLRDTFLSALSTISVQGGGGGQGQGQGHLGTGTAGATITKPPFTLRNEEFTALGDVGHFVRVPNGGSAGNTGTGSPAEASHMSSLSGAKVTINGNPIEIIGVADMSRLDQRGNPQFFSFNPGSGTSAEIAALQSALLNTAVDMSNFIPPPYMPTDALVNPSSPLLGLGAGSTSFASQPSPMSPDMSSFATGTGTSSPAAASPVVDESVITVTTIETETTNTATTNEQNSASSNVSSAASAGTASTAASPSSPNVDTQLDMLLSQGHSQGNQQSDISAIMGQIDSAVNDINRTPSSFDYTNLGQTSNTGLNIHLTGANAGPLAPQVEYAGLGGFGMNTMTTTGPGLDIATIPPSPFPALRKFGSLNLVSAPATTITSATHSPIQMTGGANDGTIGVMKTESVSIQSIPTPFSGKPHVSDLTSDGIFPFEANMRTRDMSLSKREPIVASMNRAIKSETINKDVLHMTPTVFNAPAMKAMMPPSEALIGRSGSNNRDMSNTEIAFSSLPGASSTNGGTGIFALHRSGVVSSLGSQSNSGNTAPLGSTNTALHDFSAIPGSFSMSTQSSSVPTDNNMIQSGLLTQNSGLTMNAYMLTKPNSVSRGSTTVSSRTANTNLDTIDTSHGSIDTLNVLNVGNTGTTSNNINAFSNSMFATHNLTNRHNLRFGPLADPASTSLPLTGNNGGPITNMVGIDTASSAGMSISQGIPPPPPSTGTAIPTGEFVIGAGTPNSRIIKAGRAGGATNSASFSLSSRPDTMGRFTMGMGASPTSKTYAEPPISSGNNASSISAFNTLSVDTSVNNLDTLPIEHTITTTTDVHGSPAIIEHNTTVTEIITEETITTHSDTTASSSTSHGTAASAAASTVSVGHGKEYVPTPFDPSTSIPTETLINSLQPKPFVPSASGVGGFAIGGRGDLNRYDGISLPQAAFRSRAGAVKTTTSRLTSDQAPVDMTSFVPPTPVVTARQTQMPIDVITVNTVTRPAPTAVLASEVVAADVVVSNATPYKPISKSTPSKRSRISIGSGMSVSPNTNSPGLPAKIADLSKVVDLATRELTKPPTVSHQRATVDTVFAAEGLTTRALNKPVVGSIFGSSTESVANNKITQKFLEQSGITHQPSVDFMTSFLNQENTQGRTLGGQSAQPKLQIVPLSPEAQSRSMNNMFIVGRGKNTADPLVDKFGVADITTRRQQLNPNQWSSFMSRQETKPIANYQTQNVLSASDTRPLNGNGPASVTTTFGKSEQSMAVSSGSVPSAAATNNVRTGRSQNTGLTVFEAPGMSGHRSVPISSFNNRNMAPVQSTFVARKPNTVPDPQPVREVIANIVTEVGATGGVTDPAQASGQATAIKTNEFASNFKNTLRRPGIPVNGPSFPPLTVDAAVADIANAVGHGAISSALATLSEINVPPPALPSQPIHMGPDAGFTVGNSAMISESLARPANADLQGPISTTNIERMRFGEPIVLNKVETVGTLSGGNIPAPMSDPAINLAMMGSHDPMASQRGTLTPVSNTRIQPVHTVQHDPTNKNVQATRFTSGNRFAVFGPANDVNGKSFRSKSPAQPSSAVRMGVLAPVVECRYSPDPHSRYYFLYKNGRTQHRFRCALGTAFDEMTCECSIRVSDHDDCLEVHMDFNNGVVEDSSLNRLPIGNQNVEITNSSSPLSGIALFGGDGKLTIWRYQNYDFRDHIMLKVQFRPGPGGDRFQALISNCGREGPSIAIIYDSKLKEVLLFLQTDNDTQKELQFRINPDEWNDVTYIYDGQEFIGIVNGVRRYVSRQDPHLLGIIGGEIKSVPTQGLIEIRDAAITLGQCHQYGNFIGAMVDIQVYTCIPKDFRLE